MWQADACDAGQLAERECLVSLVALKKQQLQLEEHIASLEGRVYDDLVRSCLLDRSMCCRDLSMGL
jgi:hypothetical protein